MKHIVFSVVSLLLVYSVDWLFGKQLTIPFFYSLVSLCYIAFLVIELGGVHYKFFIGAKFIGLFYWDKISDGGGANFKFLSKRMGFQNTNEVKLLLVSGGRKTFKEGEPFYEAFEKFARNPRKQVKVLLLNPENTKYIHDRAIQVGIAPTELKEQIIKSSNFLRDLQQSNPRVEYRFYDSKPDWRLTIIGEEVFMQRYITRDHGFETAICGFKEGKGEQEHSSLYEIFNNCFDAIFIESRKDRSIRRRPLKKNEMIICSQNLTPNLNGEVIININANGLCFEMDDCHSEFRKLIKGTKKNIKVNISNNDDFNESFDVEPLWRKCERNNEYRFGCKFNFGKGAEMSKDVLEKLEKATTIDIE